MSEAIEVIKREIATRQAEIAALTLALDALQGKQETTKSILLPTPRRLSRKQQAAASSDEGTSRGVYEVNGHDIALGPKMFAVLEAIAQAEDCLPVEEMEPIFDGNRLYVQQTVSALNKKLRPAGAEIVHFKGEGYRLQNIEEAGQ